jgi:DNA-directed RNA polymerase subunit RPC12/RpoP
MVIDCPHCRTRVKSEVLKLDWYDAGEVWVESYQLGLVRCPDCSHLLVGQQRLIHAGYWKHENQWGETIRVWPEPVSELALSIPETIRTCLLEARKCLHATAYTACVAMSGRGIEAMCRHFGTKKQTLFDGGGRNLSGCERASVPHHGTLDRHTAPYGATGRLPDD